MTQNNDQKILKLIQDMPEDGMALLMEQYMGLLWSACRLYLNNPEDIRECVQETFLDFYAHRERFCQEKGTLKAYLYVIAKRKAIRMAAVNDRESFLQTEAALVEVTWNEEQILDHVVLEEALSKLQEQDSRVIRMKYYDGMTCAEIAHAMQLPMETVKKRQQRSLKKLRRILVVLALLSALTACAAAVVYRYRFSSSTGFQSYEEDVASWQEMAEEPFTVETKLGEIQIQNAVQKGNKVILKLSCPNQDAVCEEISDIRLADSEGNNARISHSSQWNRSSSDTDEPIQVKLEFTFQNVEDSFILFIFGAECTIPMKPIGQFEHLSDIGVSQTKNGRTILLDPQWNEDSLHVDAYVYSENVWKITRLSHWEDRTWGCKNLLDGYAFSYHEEDPYDPYLLDINYLQLKSVGENPIVHIPIPEDRATVDIPFKIGEDEYHITEIQRTKGTYEYYTGSTDEDMVQRWGDEVLIKVEPVKLEENTSFLGVAAKLGTIHYQETQIYSSRTGKTTKGKTMENFVPLVDNTFGLFLFEPDPWIRFGFTDPEDISSEADLRIESIYKEWDENFHFRLKR